MTAQTGPLPLNGEIERVFRSRAALDRYLQGSRGRTPEVDFARSQALLVSPGPRSSTGYDLQIVRVRERDRKLTVTVRERTPGLGTRIRPVVTFPYRLVALPAERDVYVEWAGR